MTRPRSRVVAAAATLTVGALLAACSSGSTGSGAGAEAPSANALDEAEGVTTVSFWHSMEGTNGQNLDALVAEFNAAHEGEIAVEPVFQGDYDTAIAKYKAAVQSESTPALVQIYDIGSRFMMDSGQTVPMQSFIDRDDWDTSDLQPNIAGYYVVNDVQASMPFNTSMPVLYYNKTLFEQAGLDPENPPLTLEEVGAAAEKLAAVNGGPAQYGFLAAIYGWFLEQEIAANGDLYCEPENGRGEERVSNFSFDNPGAVEFVQWWKDLVDSGVAGNTGRATADAQNAFKTGTIGMTLESTGALGGMQQAAEQIGFELGVGYYPRLTQNDSGPIIGGASLWISGPGHDEAEQEAAWQFVQYLAEPATQAAWHVGTGYFPISTSALDEPEDVAWRAERPQFDVAIQQLADTELTPATQGCSAGVMPQARKAVEDALEQALLGADPQTALTEAAESLQGELDDYNASVE
jgi:sn-glycerol 3-phosphate transport system substrate-binding protein